MARKSQSHTERRTRTHAGWRGSLSFGLVTFPVEAFNALDRSRGDIHFHQIHAECHSRIHYKKVCPIHGEVPNSEIISGYEYAKDKYVELEAEELDALRSESDRALKIDAFVSPETVDPLYFDGRMYYLMPAEAASNEPYAVMLEAMEKEKRYGVGHLILSGKDQIALIRPIEGLLHMAMLNFEAEIRNPATVAEEIAKPAHIARQVKLAQTLISEWSQDHFEFSKYEDKYREKVKELIDAKVAGHEVVAPPEEKPTKVLNLMEALKRSVRGRGELPHHPRKHAAKRRSA
jgi:DNA end-binding protein Ku